MSREYSCFVGKIFLADTFVPTRVGFALDDRQYRDRCSWTSLPSPEIPIRHRRLPPPRLVVKHTSPLPKESTDSGTHPEPLQRIARRMSILGLQSWQISAGLDGCTVPGAIS